MEFKESVKDIFSVPEDYFIVNYMSCDLQTIKDSDFELDRKYGLIKGISRQLEYNSYCMENFPKFTGNSLTPICGSAMLYNRVLPLFIRKKFSDKIDLDNVISAFEDLKEVALENGVFKIALKPLCTNGSRDSWIELKNSIKECFYDTDLTIEVCHMDDELLTPTQNDLLDLINRNTSLLQDRDWVNMYGLIESYLKKKGIEDGVKWNATFREGTE